MDKKTTQKVINLLFQGKFKKALTILFFLTLLALVQITFDTGLTSSTQASLINKGFVKVERVIDGDTFIYSLNGEQKTIRLLGVDTPETVDPRKTVQCFGKEASEMTHSLLDGQEVRLEVDPTANDRDFYLREMRYVYLADGTLVNRYLIANGYAHATPEYKYVFKDEFVNLEKEASINQKGLWDPEACNQN
jgi:micrococcal nuclease